MMWVDYTIEQAGKNFRIAGDWFGEVMGITKEGKQNDHLISPGDVFVVNPKWLVS